jgi:hypothetical protein
MTDAGKAVCRPMTLSLTPLPAPQSLSKDSKLAFFMLLGTLSCAAPAAGCDCAVSFAAIRTFFATFASAFGCARFFGCVLGGAGFFRRI